MYRTAPILTLVAFALLSRVVEVEAHAALWHPSMYGFCDGGNGKDDTCINTSHPVIPLMQIGFGPGTGGVGWWFRGAKDQPPQPGVFLELPSGGTVTTEIACNKGQTSWNIGQESLKYNNVCDRPIAVHTPDTWEGGPTDGTKGCALALAWESDPDKLTPEDFIVITTNRACPFYARTTFDIPSDLPPCPSGGCHGVWGWIHGAGPSDGVALRMYLTFFKAKVTSTTRTDPLPSPRVARRCKNAPDLCVRGPKNPHYWGVNERTNAFNPDTDPPYYNEEYGMPNGAQTDLRHAADPAGENAWKDDWDYLGCYADNGPTRLLTGNKVDDWQNSPDYCRARCSGLGYTFAGLQNGEECYCGNELSITGDGKISDDGTYCNKPCKGDSSKVCGGGFISNIYAKKSAAKVATSAAAKPTTSVAAKPATSAAVSSMTSKTIAAAGAATSSATTLQQVSVSGWKTLGCWSDGQTRVLDGLYLDSASKNTPSWCAKQCAAAGYKYSGVEYSTQCLCGNSIATGTKLSGDRCNMACAQQSTAACGGSYAMNLYEIVESTSSTTSAAAQRAAQAAVTSPASRCMSPEQWSKRSAALVSQVTPTSSKAGLAARATDDTEPPTAQADISAEVVEDAMWPNSDDAGEVELTVEEAAPASDEDDAASLSEEKKKTALMHHRRQSFLKRLLLRRHRD